MWNIWFGFEYRALFLVWDYCLCVLHHDLGIKYETLIHGIWYLVMMYASWYCYLESIIKFNFGQAEANFRVDHLLTMVYYKIICLMVHFGQKLHYSSFHSSYIVHSKIMIQEEFKTNFGGKRLYVIKSKDYFHQRVFLPFTQDQYYKNPYKITKRWTLTYNWLWSTVDFFCQLIDQSQLT